MTLCEHRVSQPQITNANYGNINVRHCGFGLSESSKKGQRWGTVTKRAPVGTSRSVLLGL